MSYRPVTGIDDAFWPKLTLGAKKLGVSPVSLALVMFEESGIHPDAVNANGGASGINQFMPDTFASSFPGTSLDDFRQMTASQQLDFTLAFWSALYDAHPGATWGGARDLLWLNFLPATFSPFSTPWHTITTSPAVLAANPLKQHRGAITTQSLSDALDAAVQRSPARWDAIVANIREAQSSKLGISVALGSLLLGGATLGVALYRPDLADRALHTVLKKVKA